jgi:hypothetical protein
MSLRIASLILLFIIAGCQLAPPQVVDLRPYWLQRAQVQRFDPYPDNDIAPEVGGGRPPDFGQQVNETQRSRWVVREPSQRFLLPQNGSFQPVLPPPPGTLPLPIQVTPP